MCAYSLYIILIKKIIDERLNYYRYGAAQSVSLVRVEKTELIRHLFDHPFSYFL